MELLDYNSIKDFAYLVRVRLESLNELIDQKKTTYELINILNEEFIRLRDNEVDDCIKYKNGNTFVDTFEKANHIYIITSIADKTNSNIVLDFIKNTRGPQPLQLDSILTQIEFEDELFTNLGTDTSSMLYKFAYWPSFTESLKRLKNEALYENWSYKEKPDDDDFPILINYMKYTFAKLWKDKQITYSYDNNYVTFNSGLVNKNYQYIYVVFEKNNEPQPRWKFKDFCVPAVKAGGRLLAEKFEKLPRPAHYFNSITDISYIITSNKTPDEQLPELQFDHYFIDHPERLPMYFLEDGCRKSSEILALLKADTSSFAKDAQENHWKKIGELISDNPDVYDDLESSFRNAVRKSVMRVSWNYRTAIPVYFPTYNKMSILLPLTFGTETNAEVALVVEKMPRMDRYIAPTILDLPKAYTNARLVCKPESDWLNQGVFKNHMASDAEASVFDCL